MELNLHLPCVFVVLRVINRFDLLTFPMFAEQEYVCVCVCVIDFIRGAENGILRSYHDSCLEGQRRAMKKSQQVEI